MRLPAALALCAFLLAVRGAAVARPEPQRPACTPAVTPPSSAESLVAAGRYWHALRAAPPPPARGPLEPDSALLAIRIAEGVGEFGRIDAILRRVPGSDSVPEFLAAAARQDERGHRWSSAAARYRRLAALPGAEPALHAAAVVRLALAAERIGSREAAAAWSRAAEELPALADWFAVQRAELEPDTALADTAVALAASPGAARIADTLLARRLEATDDQATALALYLRAGDALDAVRLELALGHQAEARARADSVLAADPGRPDALEAARFLAARLRPLTAQERVAIARAHAARGRLGAAELWLEPAVGPRDTALAPRLELAAIRSRQKRVRGALAALDDAVRALRGRGGGATSEPPAVTRARVRVLGAAGQWAAAGVLAARVARTAPGDTDAAAALLTMAEHARAAGQWEEERALYRTLLDQFAAAPAAPSARLQLALSDYVAGRRDSAEAALAPLALDSDSHPPPERAVRYWYGRLRLERREPGARAALRALAEENAADFYGVRAREALGDTLVLDADSAAAAMAGAQSASRARERVVLLAKTGLDAEARAEAMGWLRSPGVSAFLLVEVSRAAASVGYGREAMLLAEAARRRAGLTPAVAQALFPYMYRGVIEAEAEEQCVDPLLMAAIVRQESRFEPRAISRAGARGMSQLMPVTGAELSRRLRLGPWNPRLLYLPDFNLHLGAVYVRDREQRDSLAVYALIASYIAGRGGVLRWRGRPSFHDVDLFVERLSSGGIRDYVRNVYANYAWYRRLYGGGVATK